MCNACEMDHSNSFQIGTFLSSCDKRDRVISLRVIRCLIYTPIDEVATARRCMHVASRFGHMLCRDTSDFPGALLTHALMHARTALLTKTRSNHRHHTIVYKRDSLSEFRACQILDILKHLGSPNSGICSGVYLVPAGCSTKCNKILWKFL